MLNKKTLQKISSFLIIFTIIISFYQITIKFDYNWSWAEIPKYFISNEPIDIQSPFDGTISKAPKQETEKIPKWVVVSEYGEKFTFKALESELEVGVGDQVYQFDYIASRKNTSIGPLLKGLWMTLKISFFAALLSLVLGIISALMKLSPNPIFSWPSSIYIELIRGTPLLVQLFIIYYMIGSVVGIESRFVCGVLALGLFAGAYTGDIIRSGIQSIEKGQMEAARSLGLNHFQSMLYIIFPQMFRRSITALGSVLISLIKDSSLVSVMALTDLTKVGREIVSSSFMVFETWIVVALLYFIITYLASWLVQKWERHLSRGEL